MTTPFVISMKIAGDSSSAVSATGALRQELTELNRTIIQTSAGAGANLQSRIDTMLGIGGSGGAGRGADIAAYGAELDRLRAKYNPLFSVIRQYRTELTEIRDANRLGAISEDEMTEAINRRRTATLGAIAALKGGAPVPGAAGGSASSFQTANIAAQFQDVLVTGIQPGANALTIALQQGTQLSAVLEQLKADGKSTGAALAGAFTSILSPMSLVTVGAIALGTFAFQGLMQVVRTGESAAQAVDRYADSISAVVAGYENAEAAAKDFANSSAQLPVGVIEARLGKTLSDANKEVEQFRKQAAYAADELSIPFNEADVAVRELLNSFVRGEISADELQVGLAKIGATDLGVLNFRLRTIIDTMSEGATKAKALESVLVSIEHALAGAAVNGGTQIGLDSYLEGQRSAQSHQIEMDAINAKSPAQLADIARRRTALELADREISEALKKQQIEEAGALAYAQASQGLADADRNRLRALNDNIAAQQLALDVIGMSVSETERLQFARQNLAAAEAEAAQNGTTVSAAYRAEVERLAASYGKLQEAIALRKLSSDLQFDREQLFRSPVEQTVASTLRPIFGDDLTSSQALFAANQIRVNEQLKETNEIGRDITGGFLSTLRADLMNGASLWEALGDAGTKALDKLADRATDFLADTAWNFIFSVLQPSSGGWNIPTTYQPNGFYPGLSRNAAGTDYWRGGLTAANENGRGEIFDLPDGTRIIPHDVSMEMARGSGGGAANVRLEIHNYSGAPVTQERTRGGDGVDVVRLVIGTVKGAIADGSLDSAMSATYGLKRRTM